ncbi:type III PLP-dependent enzyme [Seohaeicola saemankumensis]|uniref:type III PLP-dependent enzyme n=1 Tax=Seohaeicola saemankumensis TaxID=481181 RepID=UPI001E4A86FA|nr:type III PLP-dependent enzyme [Seohaeicola saemankumensis]MCD1627362.1 type III PLP-dependent enzyme [Seohaeicola saemankumensis]
MSPQNPERDKQLSVAVQRFGTPSYVYFSDLIDNRIASLNTNFGRWFALSYAMKCNPNPKLLNWLSSRIDYIDVSSGGEFHAAVKSGWDASRISFTGPAKTAQELEGAITAELGELVIESLREARLANSIAQSHGKVQNVLVRISPDRVPRGFGDHMAGRPSPFGIDIEEADAALHEIIALPNLALKGLHIYSGTQSLKPAAIAENWRIFIATFRDLCETHDLKPEKLIFGAGLGIPYHPGDLPLDISEIASDIGGDLDNLQSDPRFSNTKLVLELGRYLVGEAGFFVTRVVSIKESRGARIAICDGGMNAHLAASGHFGMVLRRAYNMHRLGGGTDAEKVDIAGPLCTSIDRLGGNVMLPKLVEADLIVIHASGAYGPTASPTRFISHPDPREVWVDTTDMEDVTP